MHCNKKLDSETFDKIYKIQPFVEDELKMGWILLQFSCQSGL